MVLHVGPFEFDSTFWLDIQQLNPTCGSPTEVFTDGDHRLVSLDNALHFTCNAQEINRVSSIIIVIFRSTLLNQLLEASREVFHGKLVAAFWGMHVSPPKHSYVWLPRKCDYRTDTQTDGRTDARQSDPYVLLCFAGDTKIWSSIINRNQHTKM